MRKNKKKYVPRTISPVDVDYCFEGIDPELAKHCQYNILSWERDEDQILALGNGGLYWHKNLIVVYTDRPGWLIGKAGETILGFQKKIDERIAELNKCAEAISEKHPERDMIEVYLDTKIIIEETHMFGQYLLNEKELEMALNEMEED